MTTTVAQSAIVESGAEVGEGTTVWDLSQVRTGARIGPDCTIGRNVFIDAGVIIGARCKIQNNALVYAPAVIGDGVFIGPAAVLSNDRNPRAVAPDGLRKNRSEWAAAGVTIEDGASVGAGVVVVAGTRLGAWCLIGAGAVVAADVKPYALVGGVPARRIGWVGRAGVRLEVDGRGLRCPATGDRFIERDGALEVVA
jgi:acetyltransferase-like isoleucine patch superfamily enzyme